MYPYDEEAGVEEEIWYRWVFPKATELSDNKDNKDEITVSIQMATVTTYITWSENGTINVGMSKGNGPWQIRPTK